MVSSIEIPEKHWKVPLHNCQCRAYAARRALTAFDRYTTLSFTDKAAVDKERALRWMRAWLALAVR
jgi:hypothetical protein